MSDDRSTVYSDGDKVIYRASSLGRCIRALTAARRGYTPNSYPAPVLKAFAEGNEYESPILAHVGKKYQVSDSQLEIEYKVAGNIYIRGHIDAIGLDLASIATDPDNTEPFLIEVKAFSAENYELWNRQGLSAFPSYEWQVRCYLLGVDLSTVLFVTLNKESKKLSQKLVSFDPSESRSMILRRIMSVERAAIADVGIWPSCEKDSFFCSYVHLHDDKLAKPDTDNTPLKITDKILEAAINRYAVLDSDIKTLGKEKDKVRDALIAAAPKNRHLHTAYSDILISESDSEPYVPHARLLDFCSQHNLDITPLLVPGKPGFRVTVKELDKSTQDSYVWAEEQEFS